MKKALAFALLCALLLPLIPAHAEDTIVFDDATSFELTAPTPQPYLPEATPFISLAKGASGDAVRRVQTRLTELGYYYGKISGDFLDGTDAATRDFQKKNGLAGNGKITATTWNTLMSPDAIGKDGQTHPSGGWPQVYAEVPAPTPAPMAPPTNVTPVPAGSFTYTRKLEYGNQGDDVRLLQQRLLDLGYFPAGTKLSGNYYDQTIEAVRAFQRNNGLKADGVAGEQTLRMLWDDSLALSAMSPPRPSPTPEPLRYLLKVDVTNQVTSAYELDANGEYTLLVRQMICSTGTKSNPTPLKTTQSKGKRARWGYFPEWDSHAQYLVRIDSKNAFHSVLYSQPDPMSLNVGAYNALGKRASHGCVRLLVADAKWIYDNCPSGTTITVYEGEPDPELTQMLKPPPLDRSVMLPRATPLPTASPVWDPNATPTRRLFKKGSEGEEVWWLQTKLTLLGYYHGTISGGYYEGTVAAVKAFQKAVGLTADGTVGPETLKKLSAVPVENTPLQPAGPGSLIPIDLSVMTTPSPAPAPMRTPAPEGEWLPPPAPPSGFEG